MAVSVHRALLSTALALALGAASVHAQKGFEHALPADCLAFIGVANCSELSEAWHASPMGLLIQDPEFEPMRSLIGGYVEMARREVIESFGVDPFSFPAMVDGAFGIALLGVFPPDEGVGHGERLPISLCLLADVGENREACAALVEGLSAAVARKDPTASMRAELVGDVQVTAIIEEPQPGLAGLGIELRHAFHGNVLVMSVAVGAQGERDMARVLAGLRGENKDKLATRADFAASAAAIDGPGVVAWADVGRLVHDVMGQARHEGEMPADVDSLLDALGLNQFTTLSLNTGWDAAGSVSTLQLGWTGEGWGPKLLSRLCRPVPFRTLAWVPADCRSAQGAQVDPSGMFDSTLKMLLQLNAVTPPELTEALSSVEQAIGFSLRDDLLDQLDGEIMIVASSVDADERLPGSFGEPVNISVLLGLRDGKALMGLLEDISRRTGLHRTRKIDEFAGERVFHLTFLPGMTLHYAVMDDLFVASLSNSMVRDVLRLRADPALPSLADDETFRLQLDRLAPGFGWLGYSDTAHALKNALLSLRQLQDMLSQELTPGEPSLAEPLQLLASLPLPDPAVVDEYVGGATVTVGRVGRGGLLIEAVGP